MQGRAEVFACHGFVLVLKWSTAILACVAGGFLGVIFESQKEKHTPKNPTSYTLLGHTPDVMYKFTFCTAVYCLQIYCL